MKTGHDHTWFVLNQRIIGKEFGLSGSEQNPDLTGKSIRQVIDRARQAVPGPVKAFMDNGADFVVERDLAALVRGMNAVTGEDLLDEATVRREVVARDREILNPFTKDLQVMSLHGARRYLGDKLIRTAAPHRILDPEAGPLVAVRLSILTRKSLGGLETDLSSRVLGASGDPLPGVYAAGRGRRVRRRRGTRLPRPGGHLPRRLHLLRPRGRPRRRQGGELTGRRGTPSGGPIGRPPDAPGKVRQGPLRRQH